MFIKDITVGIVNYNTKHLLKTCFDNLYSIDKNINIIFVDNGSSDGSASFVKANYPKVKVFEKTNQGISKSANIILNECSTKYILYIGTDAFPTKETLEKIYNYYETTDNVGIVTARLKLENGEIDMDCHRGLPTPWNALCHFSGLGKMFPNSNLFAGYFMTYENLDTIHEIGACISHYMFVKKSHLDKIGGWDPDYFVFGEDIDLCYRMKNNGYKVVFFPVDTLHLKGPSAGRKDSKHSKASKETKLLMAKASTSAMRMFYKKHYSKVPLLTAIILLGIKILEIKRIRSVS
jgi:GT2 family glycosyltransferase